MQLQPRRVRSAFRPADLTRRCSIRGESLLARLPASGGEIVGDMVGRAEVDLVGRLPVERAVWHHRVMLLDMEGHEFFERAHVVQLV